MFLFVLVWKSTVTKTQMVQGDFELVESLLHC